MTRVCSVCKAVKDSSEFHKNRRKASGLRTDCKSCVSTKMRKFYRDNAPRLKERYWSDVGIVNSSAKVYTDLLEKQGGKCASCGVHQSSLNQALALDHNHSNGQIRGLLCYRCNMALGLLCDDSERLLGLVRYLQCN